MSGGFWRGEWERVRSVKRPVVDEPQLDLFSGAESAVEVAEGVAAAQCAARARASLNSPEGRAEAFHLEHPEVLDALLDLAAEQVRAGATRLSMLELYAIVRHRLKVEMDNRHYPWYTRKLIEVEPEYRTYFRLKGTMAERRSG